MLLICETHPVPYHAAVYRKLSVDHGVPVHVLYGSDFSVHGYFDREFCSSFAWDKELLAGVDHSFVRRVEDGGARDYDSMTGRGLARCVRQLRPSAVLALGYYHPLDRAAIRVALADKISLAFRGETNDEALDRWIFRRVIRDALLRRLYRRCSSVLYIGKRARNHYQRLECPNKKLIFSPYCVDDRTFHWTDDDRRALRQTTREKLGLDQDAFMVLYSGKLCFRKGVDLIPAAVRRLPEEIRKRVHLVFLGDGALHRKLETACRKEPGVKVTFTGFQGQSDLSGYYHAADLHLLPSRLGETWGLVVNEALLHGLPSVVSDIVGCQPDLIVPGETGEVCSPDDAASLAEAMLRAISWQNKPGVAQKCREQVAHFSVEAAAKGLAEAWNAITVLKNEGNPQ